MRNDLIHKLLAVARDERPNHYLGHISIGGWAVVGQEVSHSGKRCFWCYKGREECPLNNPGREDAVSKHRKDARTQEPPEELNRDRRERLGIVDRVPWLRLADCTTQRGGNEDVHDYASTD